MNERQRTQHERAMAQRPRELFAEARWNVPPDEWLTPRELFAGFGGSDDQRA